MPQPITYSELELKKIAQRHAAWNPYWFEIWLAQNRQPDDRYTIPQAESLRRWLIRFSNHPAPPIEKVQTSSQSQEPK